MVIFKNVFLVFLIILISSLTVSAADFEKIRYKNIKDGGLVSVLEDGQTWSTKVNKKTDRYFVKKVSVGSGSYSEFYTPDGEFLFSTGTHYEFVNKGSLIGYSNFDLKFYEFTFDQDLLLQSRELTEIEVRELFKDFEIIKISDFSATTNSLKIKKENRSKKVILLNDTDGYYYRYGYTTNNAKLEKYPLTGFLKIKRKGMIQFSHFGENTKDTPWYILLVR